MGTIFVSDEFFSIAKRACEQEPSEPNGTLVALVFSALGIEAFLNEAIERAESLALVENEPEAVKEFASLLNILERQRVPIDLKIQIAHFVFKKQSLNKGELPYQDFDLLIEIRNALVHKKPEKWRWPPEDEDEYQPHRFVKRLADRGIISPPPSDMPPIWYIHIIHPQVARWSYNTAVRMVRFLVGLIPPSNLKTELASTANMYAEII